MMMMMNTVSVATGHQIQTTIITENISVRDASWLFAYLHLRNILTYLLTYVMFLYLWNETVFSGSVTYRFSYRDICASVLFRHIAWFTDWISCQICFLFLLWNSSSPDWRRSQDWSPQTTSLHHIITSDVPTVPKNLWICERTYRSAEFLGYRYADCCGRDTISSNSLARI